MNIMYDPILGKTRKAGDGDAVEYTAGFRTQILGATIALDPWTDIEDLGTSTSAASPAEIQAGHAYRHVETGNDLYLTVPSGTAFPANKYGMDAHLELFVGSTTLVHVQDPLILMDAFVPNAVNDCRVVYRDGQAELFVEDHAYGYVVNVTSGTTGTALDGSLYYGLTGTTSSYITFSHTVDGQTVSFEGATNSTARNIVGDGVENTFLSGAVDATVSLTASNLAVSGVTVSAGTFSLVASTVSGTFSVSSGGTVAFTGVNVLNGTVSGAGSVVFAEGSTVSGTGSIATTTDRKLTSPSYVGKGTVFDGITFSGSTNSGSGNGPGAGVATSTSATFRNCIFTQNAAYGIYLLNNGATLKADIVISGCTIANNSGNTSVSINFASSDVTVSIDSSVIDKTMTFNGAGKYTISDSSFVKLECRGGIVNLNGASISGGTTSAYWRTGSIRIIANSTIDLTGNTNATVLEFSGISVGAYSGDTWVVGGTASVITTSGTTVSIEGTGTALSNMGVLS